MTSSTSTGIVPGLLSAKRGDGAAEAKASGSANAALSNSKRRNFELIDLSAGPVDSAL
jgi:hypothetical protein